MPIAVRQLNFVYNPKTPYEKHALIDVNLEVNDGEFLCIVGHTGSGKSTFVQHLNALVPVQSGFVEVNGLDLTLKKKKLRREMLKQLRGQVGMVFQYPEYQLFASTVEADVAFGPQNMKLSKEEIDERTLRLPECWRCVLRCWCWTNLPQVSTRAEKRKFLIWRWS